MNSLEEDFQSKEGFSVDIWGPAAWHFLRCVAFNFPAGERVTEERKKQYMQFMKSLGDVLPCGVCRDHYPENLRTAGLTGIGAYKDRKTFAEAVHRLEKTVHMNANRRGKLPVPPFEETHKAYAAWRATPQSGKGPRSCTNKKRLLLNVVFKANHPDRYSLADCTTVQSTVHNRDGRLFVRNMNKRHPM